MLRKSGDQSSVRAAKLYPLIKLYYFLTALQSLCLKPVNLSPKIALHAFAASSWLNPLRLIMLSATPDIIGLYSFVLLFISIHPSSYLLIL